MRRVPSLFLGTDPACEFHWAGWKRQPSGAWVTDVRGCKKDRVAVDCRSLKISWMSLYSPPGYDASGKKYAAREIWEAWCLPEEPIGNPQEVLMVAEVCDSFGRAGVGRNQGKE